MVECECCKKSLSLKVEYVVLLHRKPMKDYEDQDDYLRFCDEKCLQIWLAKKHTRK